MARYEGRHRATRALRASWRVRVPATAGPIPDPSERADADTLPGDLSRPRRTATSWLSAPVLAGGLVVALGSSALAYGSGLGADNADHVVGELVAEQVSDQAQAQVADERQATLAAASRNERRSALALAEQQRIAADVTAQTAAATAKASAAAAAKAKADADAAAKAEYDRAVAAAKANPQEAARALMGQYGWGASQFSCLVTLWNGESNWRWSAKNSSSGAYGIPQSLPARKMATMGDDYLTNPITQIKWGLWYIDASYGSPCAALSFWNAQSPHWY